MSRSGRKHERIHQCDRCDEFDEKDSYCLKGHKDIYEPLKLIHCNGFKKKKEAK